MSPGRPGYHNDCTVAFANWEARAARSYQEHEGGAGGCNAHIVSLVMRAQTWHFASRNTLSSTRGRTRTKATTCDHFPGGSVLFKAFLSPVVRQKRFSEKNSGDASDARARAEQSDYTSFLLTLSK